MSMQPLGPVIVGVDGSDPALAALDLAAEEAAARVTPLTVLHAYAPGAPADAAAQDRHARRILATAVDRARVEHPALAVTARLIAAEPADALVRSAMGSSLLVLGHRDRRSNVRRPASVTARVLSGARVPVLIHRPFDTPVSAGTRPVVVALSDPVTADVLLEFAFEAAALRGAPLVALHVWPPAHGDLPGGPEAGAEGLAAAVGLWADKYPEVAVRRVLRRGVDVAVAITALSHAAQLVVVGAPRWPGRTGGSVSNALVHRAGCPVTTVPLR
jgi:nucleotide-binding universal stress UspA family protein